VIPEYRRGVAPLPAAAAAVEREYRRRAVLTVCANVGATDAQDVLDTLGLDPHEGRPTEDRSVTKEKEPYR
jgi:hypothetical protein